MAELLVPGLDGAQGRLSLAEKALVLGRGADCDVVLNEQKASRRHCRVEPKGGGWRVVDEGSANGTWVDGKAVLAVRLKPGDEIEIGDTIVTFVDENAPAETTPREPRRRHPRAKPTPWGALAVPVLAAAAAFGFVHMRRGADAEETSSSLVRYAKAEHDRAALRKDAAERKTILDAARAELERQPNSDSALRALEGAAPAPDAEQRKPRSDADWRADLADLDGQKDASAVQRRGRLGELVERYVDDPDAVAALRLRLKAELTSSGRQVRVDREKTFADADAALADGRIGEALEKWQGFIERASSMTEDDDRAIAQRLSDICGRASAAAAEAATQFDKLRRDGRDEAAQSALTASIARLAGTGFDVWLAARSGAGTTRGVPSKSGDKVDDAKARESARALQISAIAEDLARRRRFEEAAAKLDEAAAALSDPELKGVFATRAADLRLEAGFVAKLLGWIGASPSKFGTVKLEDRVARIESATASEVVVLDKEGKPEPVAAADLSSTAIVELIDKSGMDKADYVAASLLLHDLNEKEAFTKWMRAALSVDEMRMAVSPVYARCMAQKPPLGGYMPHPKDAKGIVTADEYKAIINEAKIAALRGDLLKVVDRIEKSKQAKQIDNVRKAYFKLEDARKNAQILIFDEQRYFYPYRERWKEYAPVQKEVDGLVKLVRDAWADPTKENVRIDEALTKSFAEAEKIVVDIQFYGGAPDDLVERMEKVRMYLGPRGAPDARPQALTVQTFFETPLDLELIAYNARVYAYNKTVKGATEPERKQVEITNDYRLMFGHRRALRIHPMLVTAARGHSEDMSKLGFFDHFSPVPGKRDPSDRIKLAGYPMVGCSENIAMAGGDPESAHNGWIHSSGHHRNLLSPAWIEMGSGAAGRNWTQNFGFRLDDDFEGGTPK
jgi:uncharacterized protein YkwD/pSer/pThr/pTyr-binding forkhead associated (FHA) protein